MACWGGAYATFTSGEAGVAQASISETVYQAFQIGAVAVIVHHQRFPVVTALCQATGWCFQPRGGFGLGLETAGVEGIALGAALASSNVRRGIDHRYHDGA